MNSHNNQISDNPGEWKDPQKVLVILAHPDDPEFFCGGTVSKWTSDGHEVVYWLLTCGDKGTKDLELASDQLCSIRNSEQNAAAKILGVTKVNFLNHPDGCLVPDLALRKEITRIIRQEKPDVLVTCDPTTLYVADRYLNHPDHRAAGQAALDALYPASRNHLTFIELWKDEGLEPHIVREAWISGTLNPNVVIDVTAHWDRKIAALIEHKSQIGDPLKFKERMKSWKKEESSEDNPVYEEEFRRLIIG